VEVVVVPVPVPVVVPVAPVVVDGIANPVVTGAGAATGVVPVAG